MGREVAVEHLAAFLTERSNAAAVAFYESTGGRTGGSDDLLFVYEG